MRTGPRTRSTRAGRRSPLVLLLASALVFSPGAVAPAGTGAEPPPGSIELLVGGEGGWTFGANITPDGRHIVFHTTQGLVHEDVNETWDAYFLDRDSGELELVSHTPEGRAGDNTSAFPDLSADGRFVAFISAASDLIPGDEMARCYPGGVVVTAGETERLPCFQVYLLDRETGTIEKPHDTSAEGYAQYAPAISGDGSTIAFQTDRPALPTGGLALHANRKTVTVVDRVTGEADTIFVGPAATPGDEQVGTPQTNIDPLNPDISHDGNTIVFASEVPPPPQAGTPPVSPSLQHHVVYLYDRTDERLQVISNPPVGGADGAAFAPPKVSADGNRVAFMSFASNLVPADVENAADVFLWERGRPGLRRVSVTSAGGGGWHGVAWDHENRLAIGISPDGSQISYSSSSELDGERPACEGRPGLPCLTVFVHDVEGRSTEQVVLPGGGDPHGDTWDMAMSAGGEHVLLASNARNLLPEGEEAPPGWGLYLLHRGRTLGAEDLRIERQVDTLRITGETRWPGGPAASAEDPDADGLLPGVAGTELVGGEVTVRPRRDDLAVVWLLREVMSFPVSPNRPELGERGHHAPMPLLRMVFEFEIDGRPYRLVGRQDDWLQPEDADRLTEPMRFELFDCSGDPCTSLGSLDGALGSTGREALVAIPLERIEATLGDVISGASLTTEVRSTTIDEVALGTVDTPAPHGSVTLRSMGDPEIIAEAAVDVVGADAFETTLEVGGLSGEHSLDLELCVGSTCRTERRTVDL